MRDLPPPEFVARSVDLGCGRRKDPRCAYGLDYHPTEGVDIVGCLTRLPLRTASLDLLVARHVVEHLPSNGHGGRDPFFAFFDEAWRVLRRDGRLIVEVPHAEGPSAFGDPTHRRFFTPASFAHLWDGDRDPGYRRKPWRLVSLDVSRFCDTWSYPSFRHPRLARLYRAVAEGWGRPDAIRLVLEPACVGAREEPA